MISIQEALSSISLESYFEAFSNAGFSNLEAFLNLAPQELEKILNDLPMLKGHTFKFKKMIEEAKAGRLPKARTCEVPAAVASSTVGITCGYPDPLKTPTGLTKTVELLPETLSSSPTKEVLTKVNALQGQLDYILRFKESVVKSLQEFVTFDFGGFLESLNSLKNIQDSVNGMLNEDIDMSNI
jgi:hypothetical protein